MKKYEKFVFFSAGPVGDHVILIEFAHRFFTSTGIKSTIIMKHPNKFLADFNIPYQDHIDYIYFSGMSGFLQMMLLSIKSIFFKYCYVNVLPIPAPKYYKIFAYLIRHFTRSRFVGFNLENSRNFSLGQGSSSFLGKENYINAEIDKNIFYEEANRMLKFLGFEEVKSLPTLKHKRHLEVLTKNNLKEKDYLVFHLCSSHPDRSLPTDRWNKIIKEIRGSLPDVKFVFTGAKNDMVFIKEATKNIEGENILLCGTLGTQELLTLHYEAKLNVTVHTGNMHFINMLHAPTVNLNIKGVYFFKPYYNEKQIELVATEGCVCDPYERECNMVNYKGVDYMACLFNIKDEDIIKAVIQKYNEK